MNHLKLFLFSIGLIFSINADGQDLHFSQFNSSPLNLNPALTGSINGKSRIVANYRNQWFQVLRGDAYQTYALSYDRRKNLKSGDYLGWGASGFHDISGSARFITTQFSLSLAFAKVISSSGTSSHSLIGGLQFGIAQRDLDVNNLRWPEQLDPDVPPGPVAQPDFLFADMNGGLVWISSLGERKNFHVGVSTFHLNRPNISFQNNFIHNLSIRASVHAGAELPLTSKLSILPSLMYVRQGVHTQLNFGAMVNVSNLANPLISNVQGGVFLRVGKDSSGAIHSDAIIGVFAFQLKGIQIGLSYDYTISNLNFQTLGSLEISIGYIFGKVNQKVRLFEVPNF